MRLSTPPELPEARRLRSESRSFRLPPCNSPSGQLTLAVKECIGPPQAQTVLQLAEVQSAEVLTQWRSLRFLPSVSCDLGTCAHCIRCWTARDVAHDADRTISGASAAGTAPRALATPRVDYGGAQGQREALPALPPLPAATRRLLLALLLRLPCGTACMKCAPHTRCCATHSEAIF